MAPTATGLVRIKRTGKYTGLVFTSQPMLRSDAEREVEVCIKHVGKTNLIREIVPA